MYTTTSTDRLAAPYALRATGSVASHLADIIDGPHLQGLLIERFDLDTDAAEQAAASIGATLHTTWRASGYGEDFQVWVSRLPEALLKCLTEMAARAENDEFATCHELRMARQMFTELALRISHR